MARVGRPQGRMIIFMSFVAALLLTIIPMPDWMVMFRPEWVALTLLYWCLALPQRVGVGIGFSLGIALDVLKGAILGQHALALAIIAFLAIKVHQQLRVYPMWQQALSIMALVILYQMLVLWISGIVGHKTDTWQYWLPAISSTLLWPWIYIILRDLRRHFGVR